MLARIQQLIVLSLVAGSVAWLASFAAAGRIGVAIAGPALVAAAYAGVLGLEFFWLYRSYGAADPDRPSVRQLLIAWYAEATIGPQVFLWRQPFRSNVLPDRVPAQRTASTARGIVFVHGFFCNRGIWNPWLERSAASGRPFVAVNLEPVFGSIDRYVETIDVAVRRLHDATGKAPMIVAHSMGGLAARAWLAARGDATRIHGIVTIGTPHGGTWMARHGRAANAAEMAVDGTWLTRLAAGEDLALRRRFTCFWGHCDNIVFPAGKATLAGTVNIHLPATPHVRMAFHPLAYAEAMRIADAESPEPQPAPALLC